MKKYLSLVLAVLATCSLTLQAQTSMGTAPPPFSITPTVIPMPHSTTAKITLKNELPKSVQWRVATMLGPVAVQPVNGTLVATGSMDVQLKATGRVGVSEEITFVTSEGQKVTIHVRIGPDWTLTPVEGRTSGEALQVTLTNYLPTALPWKLGLLSRGVEVTPSEGVIPPTGKAVVKIAPTAAAARSLIPIPVHFRANGS